MDKRVVFLCSGGGGNLRFIHQAIENNWLSELSLVSVLTDRECGANEYSRSNNIDNRCIDFSQVGQTELIDSLYFYQPDVIVTTVHRILCQDVVKEFGTKLINLHYSLLPAFAGLIGTKPVKEAIAYGSQFTGVTVHCVDKNLDTGRPLLQVAIPLRSSDSINSLMDLVFRCGCISLGSAINYSLSNDKDDNYLVEDIIKIKDRFCVFSKKINLVPDILDEKFWENLRSYSQN